MDKNKILDLAYKFCNRKDDREGEAWSADYDELAESMRDFAILILKLAERQKKKK